MVIEEKNQEHLYYLNVIKFKRHLPYLKAIYYLYK